MGLFSAPGIVVRYCDFQVSQSGGPSTKEGIAVGLDLAKHECPCRAVKSCAATNLHVYSNLEGLSEPDQVARLCWDMNEEE